jgi:serine protease Do
MSFPISRMRVWAAISIAFVCGLLFASSLDWTRFSWAQGSSARAVAPAVKPVTLDIRAGFADIAEQVTPSVVYVQTARDARPQQQRPRARGQVPPGFEDFFRQFEQPRNNEPQEGSGSGFIVSKDGYILTNNHVVDAADRVTVMLTDKRVFKATVVGRDPTTDIAVLKIDASDLPAVPLGDDSAVRIGDWVLAIGNPLGLDFTVTAGIVSAKGRGGAELGRLLPSRYAISDFIQTDAAINPGNSGGPLVNTKGEVIGINSAILSPTGFYSGYGLAIPISLAHSVMDDILKYGKVRRAILGVAIDDVTPEDEAVAGLKQIAGVKVNAFTPADGTSPAQRAGLEPGDVIVAIEGKPVDRVSTLQRIVRLHAPGETVAIDVMRYGSRKTFRVKLQEAPGEEQVARADSNDDAAKKVSPADKLGISVEPVSDDFAQQTKLPDDRHGLRVAGVDGSGPAHNKLFENADVLLEVLYPAPRHVLHTPSDLSRALDSVKGGDYVSLLVFSATADGWTTRIVNLRVGK